MSEFGTHNCATHVSKGGTSHGLRVEACATQQTSKHLGSVWQNRLSGGVASRHRGAVSQSSLFGTRPTTDF
eukprot:6166584-Alexandrium_andersonii.AAC.1